MERVLQKGIENGEIFAESVSLDDLISRQATVRWKHEILSYRLHLLTERGEVVPKSVFWRMRGLVCHISNRKYTSMLLFYREMRGFARVHEWFEEVWGKKSVMIKVEVFVRERGW